MRILSIDVGIKNLAFCSLVVPDIQDKGTFKIEKWDIINLAQEEIYLCTTKEQTKEPTNDQKIKDQTHATCNKPAKFEKDGEHYCLKHAKKQPFLVPTNDLHPAFIKKQKLPQLIQLAEKYGIVYEKPPKKAFLVKSIEEYIHQTCFQPIKETNASHVDLVFIGRMIQLKFDAVFLQGLALALACDKIDYVIIENQISPIANRMKTIQGMVAQYFIMRPELADKIVFISACNKLKGLGADDEQDTYAERKKLGVKKTKELIVEPAWTTFFEKHKKKDDLADSFLQGLWYIRNKV